jgi:thioredoxin-like negative regulator of GroEL
LARRALATLYLASDQRSAARTALDAIATRDQDRAVEALSQLCDLDRDHPQRLKQWTERLARLPGEDARVQAARIEVARAQNALPVPASSTLTPAPTPRTGAPFYRFAPR